jgi:hypothetical protein
VCPKFYRKVTYRAYIHHQQGFLGRGVRVPHPACLLNIIHGEWPALDSTYVGYHEAAGMNTPSHEAAAEMDYLSHQEDKAAS